MAEEKVNKGNEPKSNRILLSYFIVVLLLGTLAAGILFRAFNTAFVERDMWLTLAKNLQKPNRQVLPGRGNIYSADGKLMATSVPRYYMYLDFQAPGFKVDSFYNGRNNNVDSLAYCLSHLLKDRTPAAYKAHLVNGQKSNKKSRQYLIYSGQISYTDLKTIRQFPFVRLGANKSGFYAREMVKRQKPFGTLASRTIGDIYGEIETEGVTKGKNGLELQYDSLLRGQPGLNAVRRIEGRWTNVTAVEPIHGMDMVTTIDINMQDITEKSLVDKLREIDAESGTAIVMEVATGEIKAITNLGRAGGGRYVETMNYAVASESEPGSTFKVASMMVALEDGVCQPGDSVDVGNGVFIYNGARMTDHNSNKGGYGRITAEQAIWYSSNIGVAKLIMKAYGNNPSKYIDGLYRIGMTEDLRLEIPGAGRSQIKYPKDKGRGGWSALSLPWISFGYETKILPIQTLTFYNAIANNGKMMRPMFTKAILRNGETVQQFSPEVIKPSICSDKTLEIIHGMLLGVVEKGTGAAVHSKAVRIAGKTGTAQLNEGGTYGAGHQVSFCGYFPADDPQYTCIVVIRRPRIGYPSGGTMSGAVVKAIAEKIYATHTLVDVRKMERDSMAVALPVAMAGDVNSLKKVLGKLDVDYSSRDTHSAWVQATSLEEKAEIQLSDLTVRDGLVPNVYGMGAKDAIYLMEQAGLQVSLSGAGRVGSQSIPSGQKAVRGQTVLLTLR